MHEPVCGPNGFGDHLFVRTPDHPDELPVVWLVLGQEPYHQWSITIPVDRKDLPALIEALITLAREEIP